jgi:hypothetical protein
MQRRTLLKNLLFVAGGAAIVPSCMQKEDRSSIALKHLKIDAGKEKLLADISDTLIPASANTPGARDVYSHLFLLRMVDDCYEEKEQRAFEKGLNWVDEFSKKQYDKSFSNCNGTQRGNIIGELENKKAPEDVYDFYKITKSLTIQGFMSSKAILTNIVKYELVPGRYNGAFPVKTSIYKA